MTARKYLLAASALSVGTLVPLIARAADPASAASQVAVATPKQGARSAASGKAASAARHAQGMDPSEQLIVTGTHSFNRKARQSSSPVTVVTSAALTRSGVPNLAEALTRVYPSINVAAMQTNASALTSSIRMRGLDPNEVLVLVDGIRRHVTSNFNVNSGPEFGSTSVDLNMIPASAIDHIEVLEDGAAAMYGSDAIAGVVNIITKKSDHGLTVSGQTGADAYNGDGWNSIINTDGGLSFGRDGYLHLSGQFYHTDSMVVPTKDHRLLGYYPAGADTSAYYFDPLKVPVNSNQVLNTAEETRQSLSMSFGGSFNEAIQGYGLITYGHRYGEAMENYRIPTIAPTVYPAGFEPRDNSNENDYAATLGIKGDDFLGFGWNLSSTYGADQVNVGTKDNINLGMLKSTCVPALLDPTSLYASVDGCGYAKTKFFIKSEDSAQWTNNLDFRRRFNVGNVVPLTLAFGAEYRNEFYKLGAGEPASYQLGGPQAIAGLTPQNAGQWSRNIWAGYVDTDFHLLPKWDIDLAGRFEHYTDSGDTENGKISTRYDFTSRFAARATISNGFRAPTLAEQHYSTATLNQTSAGGLLPVSSEAAHLLGAVPLKPERSTNVSGGFVLQPIDGLHVETDVYQINIRDRILQGRTTTGAAAIQALADFGFNVPSTINPSLVSASYLANGASTRTQGFDLKADYLLRMQRFGRLSLSAGLDLNRTEVSHIGTASNGLPYLNAQGVSIYSTGYPRSKLILNALWTIGQWDVNLRQTRYGETTDLLTYQDWATGACPNGTPERYSTSCFYQFKNTPRWLTDLEVGYHITPRWQVAVGANDIFNVRPREIPQVARPNTGGVIYDLTSAQVPITGGYYYGRINYSF